MTSNGLLRQATLLALCAFALPAGAQEHTLRIQTHQSAESLSGKNAAQFVDDVQVMSGGRLAIEMFYSSAVVKSVETFDAAANGIVDGDMTGGAYQTGKNPAFQFVGDVMGGYDTPWQQYAWFYYGGGRDLANSLYNQYNMELIGWWMPGQESMSSSKPLDGPEALKDWKFRSPPGLETEIFAALGASPVVMDFGEIFTALETGIIDGADASAISNNKSMGIYDVVDHTTYPGFHSMPADHLAIRKDAWEALPEDLQRIVEVAMEKLAFRTSLSFADANEDVANAFRENGEVTLHDWSAKDRAEFRRFAQENWERWAERTPEAREIVDSHVAYMKKIGLIEAAE